MCWFSLGFKRGLVYWGKQWKQNITQSAIWSSLVWKQQLLTTQGVLWIWDEPGVKTRQGLKIWLEKSSDRMQRICRDLSVVVLTPYCRLPIPQSLPLELVWNPSRDWPYHTFILFSKTQFVEKGTSLYPRCWVWVQKYSLLSSCHTCWVLQEVHLILLSLLEPELTTVLLNLTLCRGTGTGS